MVKVLDKFPNHYSAALRASFFKRLGITPGTDADKDMAFINFTFCIWRTLKLCWRNLTSIFAAGAGELKKVLKGPDKIRL